MKYSGICLSNDCLLQGPCYPIQNSLLTGAFFSVLRKVYGRGKQISRWNVEVPKCFVVRYAIVHQVVGCALELTDCVPVARESANAGSIRKYCDRSGRIVLLFVECLVKEV